MRDIIEVAARVAHEMNRRYCQLVGDNTQQAWESTPIAIRQSARSGVEKIRDNPELTPEQSHEGWFSFKQKEGWVYGPIKDLKKKEHPCMVAYGDLPLYQRAKDAIFGAAVRSVLDDPRVFDG